MTISSLAGNGAAAIPQASQTGNGNTSAASGASTTPAQSPGAGARSQLNVQILKASLEVSIQAGDNSQAALFSAAIDKINSVLAPDLGPDAVQAAMSQDNSPEATAGRIVSLSTAFFDAYAAKHPNQDPETLARDFVDLIRGGFEKGFGEARDLLKGLGVFNGDVESGIMKTYDLVHKGLDDFLTAKLALLSGNGSGSGSSGSGSGGDASGATGGAASGGSDKPAPAAS